MVFGVGTTRHLPGTGVLMTENLGTGTSAIVVVRDREPP
jgi:hypothetical protein